MTNVQTGIPTDGQHLSAAGVMVQAVLNAKAENYASTTHLPLWHLHLLPTGTLGKTAALQTWFLQEETSHVTGSATAVGMSGRQHPT